MNKEINRRVQQYGSWCKIPDIGRAEVLEREMAEALITQVELTAEKLTKKYWIPYAVKFFLQKPPTNSTACFGPYSTAGWKFNAVYAGSNWGYVCDSIKQWLSGIWWEIKLKLGRFSRFFRLKKDSDYSDYYDDSY